MTNNRRSTFVMRVAGLALALACIVDAQAQQAAPADKQALALSMVQKYDFGRNLQTIGFAVLRQTQDYPAIVHTLGDGDGDALIQRELARLAPKYQAQWDANLAASYGAVYSAEELQSFATQGPQSDHIDAFNQKRGAVGALMRDKSQALLKQYVTEALSSVQKIAAAPRDTIQTRLE